MFLGDIKKSRDAGFASGELEDRVSGERGALALVEFHPVVNEGIDGGDTASYGDAHY
jgi:hypothetical protein